MGVDGCAPHDMTWIALPGQEGTLRQEVREAKEYLQLDGGEREEGGARGHLGMSVSGCISHVARGPPRFLSVTVILFMLPRSAFAANQMPGSFSRSSDHHIIKSPDHQVIKSSDHEIIISSNHQITKSSDNQFPDHQIIESSDHHIIKSSNHQIVNGTS